MLQHNLELFWGKMQELAEAGTPSEVRACRHAAGLCLFGGTRLPQPAELPRCPALPAPLNCARLAAPPAFTRGQELTLNTKKLMVSLAECK